ncbi:protein 5NUC-like isoform X2 [Dermacentor albipictus]|uniref:protein 5NUC-like isoform X2 n=1 Tax=Dermacentor albipictus TaxID=60249 RepID=UPI0038FD3748
MAVWQARFRASIISYRGDSAPIMILPFLVILALQLVCTQSQLQRDKAHFRLAAATTPDRAVAGEVIPQGEPVVLSNTRSRHAEDEGSCSPSKNAQGSCYMAKAAVRAQDANLPSTIQPPTLVAAGASATGTLSVVHSGELLSHFLEVDKEDKDCTSSKKTLGDCFGGAARISYQMLVNKPGISLYTGNIYGGHVWFRIAGIEMVINMLNAMAFDVLTLGRSEFQLGSRGLAMMFGLLDTNTKIVLCNVDFSREPKLSNLPNKPTRSVILTVGNLKVGITGYVSSGLSTASSGLSTIIVNDPADSLRNESYRLREEGCHIVLAIGGGDTTEDRHLADILPDITAFVVKYHAHFAYPSSGAKKHMLDFDQDLDYPINFTRSVDGKPAYIFASTNHYQLLSKFQITVDTDHMRVLRANGDPVILDMNTTEDQKTRELMNHYSGILGPKAMEVIGTTKVYIDNSKETCETRECNGGNLLADAVFDYFSEVAVAGAWSQINAVVVNAGALSSSFDERTKSGMRVRYKTKAGVNESIVSKLLILCTSCRTPTYERVISIQWYTVAMNEFLADGGDGYDFTRVPRGYKVPTNVTDDIIMRHYLEKRSPIMPMLDGRISFRSRTQALGAPYWAWTLLPSLWAVAAVALVSSA